MQYQIRIKKELEVLGKPSAEEVIKMISKLEEKPETTLECTTYFNPVLNKTFVIYYIRKDIEVD